MKWFSRSWHNIKNNFFKFSFEGRTTNTEFIDIALVSPIALGILFFFSVILSTAFVGFIFLTLCIFLLLFINSFSIICALVRRLHDVGLNGLWSIPILVISSFIGFLSYLALMIVKSKSDNKYGPNFSDIEKEILKDDNVRKFLYYQYFKSNPLHEKMTLAESKEYNERKCIEYKSSIPAERYAELKGYLKEGSSLLENNKLDFMKDLPNIVDIKNNTEAKNIDYEKMISRFNSKLKKRVAESRNAQLKKMGHSEVSSFFKEKEIGDD